MQKKKNIVTFRNERNVNEHEKNDADYVEDAGIVLNRDLKKECWVFFFSVRQKYGRKKR